MTVVVVDVLEIVEIDERQRETAAIIIVTDQGFDTLFYEASVGELGQFVDVSALGEPTLDLLVLGDIDGTRNEHRSPVELTRLVGDKPGSLSPFFGYGRLDRDDFALPQQGLLPFPPAPSVLFGQEIRRRSSNQALWRHP